MTVILSGDRQKQTILIVDDSEMNRSILADMLGEEYEIIEAEDGQEAVQRLQKHENEISLVLLDMVMPGMDGFGVLNSMKERKWIEDIPVIMISATNDYEQIELAYDLGVTDFIARPFDSQIVHHRVNNTILLYAKQKKLIGLVADQIYENAQRSSMMVDILSHIVEFRNGESGLHIIHVRTITELLLKYLGKKSKKYRFSRTEMSLISTASAFHDVGKIAIDEKILNKPGRLTEDEFEIMKTHALIGAKMLDDLPIYRDEPLIRKAYEICRWHHERYDGKGYPDGISGDEIPISAQIVALADVYDALTSERVYKKAYSHEKAVSMILDGQCGAFNPLLLECFSELAEDLETELKNANPVQRDNYELWDMTREKIRHEEMAVSERSLRLLEYERMKYNFFAVMTQEIQFEYTVSPPMLTLSDWGAKKLGLDEIIVDPKHDQSVQEVVGKDAWKNISDALHRTTPVEPITSCDCKLNYNGQSRWCRIVTQAIWSPDEIPRYCGAIGKVMDIHESRLKMQKLEKRAYYDALTGLLNHFSAKKLIEERLEICRDRKFVLAICDLDQFKFCNDNYGHQFGDGVLKYVSQKLQHRLRADDIIARMGGDEFLIFFEYENEAEKIIELIYSCFIGTYERFEVSASIGAACTSVVGFEYAGLFHAADQALYSAKKSGRRQYRFYDETMKNMLSVVSSINGDDEE